MPKPYGIYITSYEFSGDEPAAILSHIFWGKTYNEAFRYAKSHLISDAFFNGTFTGELPWNNTVLVLGYDGQIYSVKNTKFEINKTIKELTKHAKAIHKDQEKLGMIQVVQQISQKK